MPKKKKIAKKLKGKKVGKAEGMHKMAGGMMMSDEEMKKMMAKKAMMSGNRPGKVSHYRKS